jgi:hypothetical protein
MSPVHFNIDFIIDRADGERLRPGTPVTTKTRNSCNNRDVDNRNDSMHKQQKELPRWPL